MVPGTGFLLSHTQSFTPHSLSWVARSFCPKGFPSAPRPAQHSTPSHFTLVHSTFHSSPKKRHCDTETKETSRRCFSLAPTISFFFFVHIFQSCEGVELFHLASRRKFVSKTGYGFLTNTESHSRNDGKREYYLQRLFWKGGCRQEI